MNIEVIHASAGSGKTYALADRLQKAIEEGSARPDRLVAITYTNRAAAELSRRLRRRLVESGHADAAARIRDGYLGTVHSVCQRLIGDLAFEAGSSPFPEPAPEALCDALFAEVTGEVLEPSLDRLGQLAEVLGLKVDDGRVAIWRRRRSWRDVLRAIVDADRENRLGAAILRKGAQHSANGMKELLGPAQGTAEDRDTGLLADLAGIRAWVEAENAATGDNTTGVMQDLERWTRGLSRSVSRGRSPAWGDLASIMTKWSAKKYEPVVGGLRAAFADHLTHPRFHTEIETIIREIFRHASRVQDAFVARKQAERLLDFGDMLAQAADLLRCRPAREALDGRIDLLMVDEFQDTSPVQLEVILALAELAPRTVWVGDRKQAIFGFQGSDPGLIEQATKSALEGRRPEVLELNYRSRPPLVHFCSELFAAALEPLGFSPREVALEPACPEPLELRDEPALHFWATTIDDRAPRAKPKESAGIARQVRALLDEGRIKVRATAPDPTQVAEVRAARPGDVAVLARTNSECQEIARALTAVGVVAMVAQDNLGATPEAKVLRAGLALIADPHDRLAAAEVLWFTSSVPDPDEWLGRRIAEHSEANERGEADLAFPEEPLLKGLRERARASADWSPGEAVLAVLDELNLPERVLGWPDPQRRFANLEALRGVAREYEDTCRVLGSAATVAGLVRYLDDLPQTTTQALPTDLDAVQVLTYHKAKGLEWPVVICASMGKVFTDDPFDVRVIAADEFDLEHPLAGRTIRWWPWPYGAKSSGLELGDRARNTPIARAAEARSLAENVRLLYVGFTRARDHLVLSSVRHKSGGTAWLDLLVDRDGHPLLTPPWDAKGRTVAHIQESRWDCDVRSQLGSAIESVPKAQRETLWFVRPDSRTARASQVIRPSEQILLEAAQDQVTIADVVQLGPRPKLQIDADGMTALGDVVHRYLAATLFRSGEDHQIDPGQLLHAYGLDGQVSADAIRELTRAFDRWIDGHAPGSRYPEWPVRWKRPDGRVLLGEIDLLVPLDGGWLILDHKSFPGNTEQRDRRIGDWAGQLAAYREAVEAATDGEVKETWVHLPIRGEVVRLDIPPRGARI